MTKKKTNNYFVAGIAIFTLVVVLLIGGYYSSKQISYSPIRKTNDAKNCLDQCNPAGNRICDGSDSYIICDNYDSDLCLEWGDSISCGFNRTCSNGFCKGLVNQSG